MKDIRICLNMIVKDESHIIEKTLDHLKKYISYWVISDTGSTDNTKDIIKNFFKKNKIPGKLVEHKWEDFGTNRSLALETCYPLRENFDYIWVFDADDLIMGDIIFPKINKKPNKNPDFYTVKYGSGFTYMRNQIFKSTEKWCYIGVLHEYPKCISKEKLKSEKIDGEYYIDSRRLGARSKASDKYLRDAKILEKGLVKEPDNERYMFYLGQSYIDSEEFEKSIYWYQKRIDMGRWFEEVYYSYYQIAKCKRELKKSWKDVEKSFMEAWKYLPSRAEPLYEIAKHYRIQNNFEQGYKYSKLASNIPFPKDQVLFIYKSVYDYQILDELSICASYIGKYQESIDSCKKILKICPKENFERIENNMNISLNKLKNQIVDTNKNVILTMTMSNEDQKLCEYWKDLKHQYCLIFEKFEKFCKTPSSMNEHILILYYYAKKTSKILDCVNNEITFYTFVKSLIDNLKAKERILICENILDENLNFPIKYKDYNFENKFDLIFINSSDKINYSKYLEKNGILILHNINIIPNKKDLILVHEYSHNGGLIILKKI